MMGSCSLWLLLVALLSSVRIYSQQRTEDHGLTFLVAIKSNESGLEINTHLRLENHGNEDIERYRLHPESQVLFIPGHNLSSACGDQYFRCQELLVKMFQGTNSNRKINNIIVFVPLETGILLLFNWYDSYNVEMKLRGLVQSPCGKINVIMTLGGRGSRPMTFYNCTVSRLEL